MTPLNPTPALTPFQPATAIRLPDDRGPLDETRYIGDRYCIETRGSVRESFTEFFITASVLVPMSAEKAAEEVFALVAEIVAQKGVRPLQEKIFGLTALRTSVMKIRENHYRRQELDLTAPTTWIMGTPLSGCDFVGVQIWGMLPHRPEVQVRTVENPVTGPAREFVTPGLRMVYLPVVRGLEADGKVAATAPEQTELMFTRAENALAKCGLGFENVVRTWIYYAHLLDWYNDLNRIRTRHYQQIGFGKPGRPAFPASTGIQGQFDKEECMMDVLALEQTSGSEPVAQPIIHSPRQEQSFNYGSAFSRGMTFKIEGRRTVSISGTASINAAGATIHVGNAELQCFETLMCISAILAQQGGSLENISAATLYCKDRSVWDAWNRVCRLMGVPAFPRVCVIADVCRDDLLVEMEAFATF